MPIPSNVFNDAVRGFWNQRIAQRQAQELLGKIDQGNRRDVTGGKQMDGFALAITNLLLDAGISQQSIHIKKSLTVLPGFFRPTKTYDFLVVSDGQFKAAIELKFKNSSYAKRYELFCRKMVRERHYNAACFLMADKDRVDEVPNYIEPASDLSADNFLIGLLRHVVPI